MAETRMVVFVAQRAISEIVKMFMAVCSRSDDDPWNKHTLEENSDGTYTFLGNGVLGRVVRICKAGSLTTALWTTCEGGAAFVANMLIQNDILFSTEYHTFPDGDAALEAFHKASNIKK